MSRPLAREEIVGFRLQRIMQTYQVLDDWLDHRDHTFVLESGIAFRLPEFSDQMMETVDIPPGAVALHDPLLERAFESRIETIYRPADEELWIPDGVWLKLVSGIWIGQLCTAPQGTGGAGLRVEQFDSADGLVDYWSSPAG